VTEEATEEGRIESISSLAAAVRELKEIVMGRKDGTPEAEPEAADPKAEMRAELAKLQRAEKAKAARQAEKDANESRFKAIEDKLMEKPPEEYSRITRFMGWRGQEKQ
jgi:hypothetical protein